MNTAERPVIFDSSRDSRQRRRIIREGDSMSRMSRHLWAVVMSLLLTTSLTFVNAAAQSSAASPQNKAKACNDLADKKGLKDQERKDFLQSCLGKAADSGSASGGKVS